MVIGGKFGITSDIFEWFATHAMHLHYTIYFVPESILTAPRLGLIASGYYLVSGRSKKFIEGAILKKTQLEILQI